MACVWRFCQSMPWVPGYNSDRMSEIARLLIDLQRTRASEDTVALGLRLKDDPAICAVLVVRGNQVVDVLATGATPEEACRAALDGYAAAALRWFPDVSLRTGGPPA